MFQIFKSLFSIKIEEYHKIIKICGIKIKLNLSKNNKIVVIKNGKSISTKKIKGLKIKIKGSNNNIILEAPYNFNRSKIAIRGNYNNIHIKPTKHRINELTVSMLVDQNNRIVNIGKDFSCVRLQIDSWASNTKIDIGNDCQFSKNIFIRASDGHMIFNKDDTNTPINKGFGCSIGNHVWCGQGVHIGKNVKIADNTIIGEASVVIKSIEEEGTAIAGCPAKIVRRNLTWARDDY